MPVKPFHHIGLIEILEEQLWLAFTNSGICASKFKEITTLKSFKKQLKEKTGNSFLKVDSLPEEIEDGINPVSYTHLRAHETLR